MDKGEGVLGFFGIFLACAPLELWWRENPQKEPGNYGDPFGVNMYTEEMRMKELNNGRMAMISVLGIFAAEMATGKDAMQQFGLPAIGGARASASSSSSFAGSTSSRMAAQQRVVRRAEAVIQEDAPPLFQPSEQFGSTEPVGFFDPLGFTEVGDEKGFRKLRVSEIKHGRVAMMASIGLVAQHFVKFPFFENAPAGFSIMDKGEGVLGFFGIFLACAPLELWWRENPQKEPGNYGDPFGVNMYTEEMRMKELNNGRMAMISVLGIFAAEMATGKDAMQQFGLPAIGGARASASSSSSFAGSTSSRMAAQQRVVRRAEAVIQEDAPPLFQPSEQFGSTEPVGFFDPLGFTEVGDEKGFRKLRVSEIKHGRVGAAVAPQTATIGTTSTRSCLVKTDGACVISFASLAQQVILWCLSNVARNKLMHSMYGNTAPAGSVRSKWESTVDQVGVQLLHADELKLPGDAAVATIRSDQVSNGAVGFAFCNSVFLQPKLKVKGGSYLCLLIPGVLGADLKRLLQDASPTLLASAFETVLSLEDPKTKRCFPRSVVGVNLGLQNVTVAQLPPSVQQTDDSSVVVWVHAHQRYSPDEWSKCVGPNMREVRLTISQRNCRFAQHKPWFL